MDGPFTVDDAEALERALMLGLSRTPLPPLPALDGHGDPALAALAVLAAQRRFRLPDRPTPATVARVLPDDDRPMLDARQRRLLLRLVPARRNPMQVIAVETALRRIALAGLRLNPLDLPLLEGFLQQMPDQPALLGPSERAWLSWRTGRQAASGPEDWTSLPKARRLAFLHDRRRRDPAGARALVEAALPSLSAAERADVVGALAVNAGPDDLPLLAQLKADRAPKVREAVALVLCGIRGTREQAELQDQAAAALRVHHSAFGSRLEFRPNLDPPTSSGRFALMRKLVEGSDPAVLAARLGLDMPEFATLARDSDVHLRMAVTTAALRSGQVAMAGAIMGEQGMGWPRAVGTLLPELAALAVADRLAMLRSLVRPDAPQGDLALISRLAARFGDSPPVLGTNAAEVGQSGHDFFNALPTLARLAEGPLPSDLADRLLAASLVTTLLAGLRDGDAAALAAAPDHLLSLTLVLPHTHLHGWRKTLAGLPASVTGPADTFARFALSLPHRP